MKKQILSSIVIGIAAVGFTTTINAAWRSSSNGNVPKGSIISGHEANGAKLYACRARHNGGVHPGKVRRAFGGCNIGWGGKEITIKQYETFVIWQYGSNGSVPRSAVVGGQESNGTKLYVCRGNYQGGVHSGKVRSAFRACNIGWGGKEVKVNPYEVLIR